MSRKIILLLVPILIMGLIVGCGGYKKNPILDKVESTEKGSATATPQPAVEKEAAPQKIHPIRNESNNFVTLETSVGNLTLELFRDVAPAHADSFLARSNEGFYNGTVFHRIIKGFMLQGGDPTGTGAGNADYYLDAEFSDLKHLEGTLSMARAQDPNSASCQFFICFDKVPSLNGQYTVFGHLIKGYETLKAFEQVPVMASMSGERSKPIKEMKLIRAYQSDAEGNEL